MAGSRLARRAATGDHLDRLAHLRAPGRCGLWLAIDTDDEWIDVLSGGRITLWWDDVENGEPLDFRVRLTPLDAAGNEGPTLEIPVHDGGAGCAAGSGGAGLLQLLAVAGFLVGTGRRCGRTSFGSVV